MVEANFRPSKSKGGGLTRRFFIFTPTKTWGEMEIQFDRFFIFFQSWLVHQKTYQLPWEPKTFIFRGYNPYIWGVKPSFFMVLGSKGRSHFSFSPFVGVPTLKRYEALDPKTGTCAFLGHGEPMGLLEGLGWSDQSGLFGRTGSVAIFFDALGIFFGDWHEMMVLFAGIFHYIRHIFFGKVDFGACF